MAHNAESSDNRVMRIYLDICCLKRPFDDQTQPRVHLESEAVLAILDAPADQVELLHVRAHDLENEQNSSPQRAANVRQWLQTRPRIELADATLVARTAELMALGFKNFDAFHIASAEAATADVFVTCEDRLLATARRHAAILKVRVIDLLTLAGELFS